MASSYYSAYDPVMSKFYLKVDLIKVGSWSIMVMPCLISLRGKLVMFWPSISTSPLDISVTLSRVLIIVVFPAPVRPTIPIFSPGFIVQLSSLMTLGKS